MPPWIISQRPAGEVVEALAYYSEIQRQQNEAIEREVRHSSSHADAQQRGKKGSSGPPRGSLRR